MQIKMKRVCEPNLAANSEVNKKAKLTLNLSNISNVNFETIQISESVIDLDTDCSTEIIDSNDGSHITQDEDSLVAGTSFGILVEFMDITEPLTKLRTLLEQRTGMNLSDYKFFLQDSQELDPNKNLVNQCVQGEGLVQINVDVTDKEGFKKINIVDVLKPVEEIPMSPVISSEEATYMESTVQPKVKSPVSPQTSQSLQQITRWYASPEFKTIQEKYGISNDPFKWTEENVRQWFIWASCRFNLPDIDVSDWDISGAELMNLSQTDFMQRVPIEQGNLFWTHLDLLKKFKIVFVIQNPNSSTQVDSESTSKSVFKQRTKSQRLGTPRIAHEGSPGYSGQIQLWQFLLELLTNKDHRNIIQWVGNEGEFKLINPEMVAQLWGLRKNKPTMNYEKLSRALRYYYDGEMIAKVHGKRFVYKFVYDLKNLLGYDAAKLNSLVTECAMKHTTPRIVTFASLDNQTISSS